MLTELKILLRRNKLRLWFGGACTFAFVICAAVFFFFRPLVCPPRMNDYWTAYSYQYSNPQYYGTQQRENIVAEHKKQSYKKDETTQDKYADNFYDVVCNDVRLTDFAIILFTLYLAVVGWFAMRNTDETTKRERRAYVVAGPLYGIANKGDGIDDWTRTNRALAEMFHGPYRLALMNFGQTAGFTTKVEWGICKREEFKDDVLVSDIVRKRKYSQWWRNHQARESPVLIQDILEPSGNNPKHYRHVEYPDRDALIGFVLFGKITYKDVFGDKHWTTFAYYIWKDHTDSLPKSLSDDHS